MKAGRQLQDLFGLTYWAIRENLKDVDHEESLHSPDPAGNCINWVLGHILVNRDRALLLLNQEPVWTEEESSRYARGTPPLEPNENVERLEKITDLLELSQEHLFKGLGDEDLLSTESGESTLGVDLFTFNFHESYHAGQLGILRRLAGKKGAIP